MLNERWMNKQRLFLIAWGILIAGILIPNTPLRREIPTRDSGVFLYIGEQILNGEIPYRDVWDHKPPAIHYINALGLFVGKGSVWGVNLLEFGALYLAGILGYMLAKRALGVMPAIFGVVAWLVTLTLLLGGGNFTEEFALPCQFAALYLFWQAEQRRNYSWRGFLIGITAAISFLLKQNLIGIQLSIMIFLLLTRVPTRRWRDFFTNMMTISSGSASVIFIVGLYFARQGALSDLWDNAFAYNLAYSTTMIESKIIALAAGLVLTSFSGMSVLALTTWFAGVIYLLRDNEKVKGKKALLALSLINLPVELFLVAISGKPYPHYYIAWLPAFAILASFFAHYSMTRLYPRLKAVSQIARTTSPHLWLSAFLCIWSAAALIGQMVTEDNVREATGHLASEHIAESTVAGEYVLIWGAETSVNFAAQRRSPTRFVYQYPLYTRGYQSITLIQEFLDDIVTNKPVLIIDTSPSNELIPPIDPIARTEWNLVDENYDVLPAMDSVFDYLVSNYRPQAKIGQDQWSIYVYAGE